MLQRLLEHHLDGRVHVHGLLGHGGLHLSNNSGRLSALSARAWCAQASSRSRAVGRTTRAREVSSRARPPRHCDTPCALRCPGAAAAASGVRVASAHPSDIVVLGLVRASLVSGRSSRVLRSAHTSLKHRRVVACSTCRAGASAAAGQYSACAERAPAGSYREPSRATHRWNKSFGAQRGRGGAGASRKSQCMRELGNTVGFFTVRRSQLVCDASTPRARCLSPAATCS